MSPAGDEPRPGSRAALLATGITVLYLLPRVAFLLTRPPFYDELFTKWIAAKPFSGIVAALRADSGPPLYYFIVHVAHGGISGARVVSLIAAGLMLVVLLRRREWTAALLLAAYPAAIFTAADGRAYACCALFAGIGCLALDQWAERRSLRSLALAVCALVFAAYSHDYGVLMFPLPFVIGALSRDRRRMLEGIISALVCGVLFIPGFLLAAGQPRAATQWMQGGDALSPLSNLAFASRYPDALMPAAPWLLVLVAMVVMLVSISRTVRSPRAVRFAAMTLSPALLLALFFLAGLRVYFPLRFESVIAVPLMLWLACALAEWGRGAGRVLMVATVMIGLVVAINTVTTFRAMPPEPFRVAAKLVRQRLRPGAPIVASGYLYLETLHEVDAGWPAHIMAFPEEQAQHPGWRTAGSDKELRQERDRFLARQPNFIWIGEATAPELRVFAETCDAHVLYRSPYVVIARLVKRASS